MLYPELRLTDKNGNTRQWYVESKNDGTIIRTYGMLNGKLITNVREFKGKNIGRSNETSAVEQAEQEAISEWISQIDKGYRPICNEGRKMMQQMEVVKGNATSNVGIALEMRKASGTIEIPEKRQDAVSTTLLDIRPMHCEKWSEEAKVLKYFDFTAGVYVQPKIDGVRCLVRYNYNTRDVEFISRQGKPIVHLQSLRNTVANELFCNWSTIIFDCELYAHVITDELGKEVETDAERFNVISGACRPVRKSPHPLEDQICLYIFDILDTTMPQAKRTAFLQSIMETVRHPRLVLVPTCIANDISDIVKYHDLASDRGYEGVVIRAHDLMYVPDERSNKMRKYKYFSDAEYTIVGAECDPGVDTEFFTWVCETSKGQRFNVKPTGSRESRRNAFATFKNFIGKQLTVKYQLLSPEGVPRFPIGKGIRND